MQMKSWLVRLAVPFTCTLSILALIPANQVAMADSYRSTNSGASKAIQGAAGLVIVGGITYLLISNPAAASIPSDTAPNAPAPADKKTDSTIPGKTDTTSATQ